MKLIVGLGNPGEKYAKNRHNIGFMALDALAKDCGASAPQKKFHGQFVTAEINGQKVGLLWPQTYMNESGRAVQATTAFYKIKPEDILIIHDELDLEPGDIRHKIGGGDAGHNGLKSITKALGKNYGRLRLGIGHPGDKEKVSPYVLSNFAKKEQETVAQMIKTVVESLHTYI